MPSLEERLAQTVANASLFLMLVRKEMPNFHPSWAIGLYHELGELVDECRKEEILPDEAA